MEGHQDIQEAEAHTQRRGRVRGKVRVRYFLRGKKATWMVAHFFIRGTQRQSDASLFPDVDSSWNMMNNKEILYHEKRIGNIPGIEVGYQFYSRAEMVAVGFHSHWLNGIDYMGLSYSKTYSSYEFLVAVAIVISGMYEDDLDNVEDVVYTSQGYS